jgi:predicted RNase H-like nuclease (RuvC/YqgF family)
MTDNEKLVDELKKKANLLISSYQQLKNDVARLTEENKRLKSLLNEKASNEERLIEETKLRKLSQGISTEDKKEVKLKINELVREIDSCIARLNN